MASGLLLLLGLTQCSTPLTFSNDTKQIVEAGLSELKLLSASFVQNGTSPTNLSSGTATTANITLINPKSQTAVYTLSWNLPNADFSTLPTPLTVVDPKTLTFGFTLATAAEHQDVIFTLGIVVPATGKTYPSQTFQAHCDTPPTAATSLTIARDSNSRAFIVFVLPSTATDTDLTSVILTYQDTTHPSAPVTVTLGVNNSALTTSSTSWTPAVADPLGAVANERYFAPTPAVAQFDAYSFQVVVVDAAGQKSAPVTVGASGITYAVTYNANATLTSGSVPTDLSLYSPGASVTVAGNTNAMARTGYIFGGWTWGASPTVYGPAATTTIAMPGSNLTLDAVWTPVYTVTFSAIGASGTLPSSVTQTSNTSFTVPGAGSLVNGSQLFDGWTTGAGGTGTAYNAGDSFTITGNATLYAFWLTTTPATLPLSATVTVPSGVSDLTSGTTNNMFSTTGIVTTTWPTTVVLPSTMTNLGYLAFHDCYGLTSITIPSSVTTLGYGVFLGDSNVAVTMTSTTPPTNGGAFDTAGTTALVIRVPAAALATYQAAAGWSAYASQMVGY